MSDMRPLAYAFNHAMPKCAFEWEVFKTEEHPSGGRNGCPMPPEMRDDTAFRDILGYGEKSNA
jgi:hypothetical protein